MKRREFVILLCSGAAAWPFPVTAQQPPKIPLVGILTDGSAAFGSPISWPSFAKRMRDLGYNEGKNITAETRYAELKAEIFPGLAAELVRLQPNVIVAIGTLAALAVKAATQTIPIVFTRIGDPVASDLVATLAQPGGNLTGLSPPAGDRGQASGIADHRRAGGQPGRGNLGSG